MNQKALSTAIALNARLVVVKVAQLVFNRYTAFLLGLLAYFLGISFLGGLGGVYMFKEGEIVSREPYLELTLVFSLYCYFNLILRPSRWQPFLAAIPLFLAYLGQDIYYLMYGNVFRAVELGEVPELLKVMSPTMLLLLALFAALPLAFFLWSINYRRFLVILAGCLPVVALIGATKFAPETYLQTFQRFGREIVFWSDAVSVENNGRFMMLLYREAERQISMAKTASFRDRPAYEEQAKHFAAWVKERSTKRNVHLVVMESFVDPTLFRNARFSMDPTHPSFKNFFGDKVGFSISPVIGGKTAQAEFEVLCGVPAFEELAGVDFNVFTGSAAYCLPAHLELAGYRTMASNAYKPSFFNATSAYRGMGFGAMYFPREFASDGNSYLTIGDSAVELDFVFDRELFNQNLEFLAPFLKDADGPPLFNYILTSYGHWPHILDPVKRPEVLKLTSSFKDPQLERIANQYYYRTEAVVEFVKKLIELDERSLIIIVSDHVPATQFGMQTYKKLAYLNNKEDAANMNRLLVIEGGKIKKFSTVHHYDLPAVILNFITGGSYCRERTCGFVKNKVLQDRADRHDDYMRVMAHASE